MTYLALVFACALLVAALVPSISTASVLAQVGPGDIALNLGDLGEGYEVDPRYTRESTLEGVGPAVQVQFAREPTLQNLQAGPIVVGQFIARLDSGIGTGDALLLVKNRLIEQNGLVPSENGPNDGGTFTLWMNDGQVQFYSVGFAKENMIIVTSTGGLPEVVTAETTLDLAGISSAKLDAVIGR
jgi:hypothetical protein